MNDIKPFVHRPRSDNNLSETPQKQFKVCLIGDGFVGKTSIRESYLGNEFKASYIPTLGVDFAMKEIDILNTKANLIVWDIAGQELFNRIREKYYIGTSGIVLVYSVVDRETFDNASKWLVEAHGFMKDLPPIIVAANKIDLRKNKPKEEVVSTEEGEEFTKAFSNKLNARAAFIESSALTGENIHRIFEELTKMMLDDGVEEQKPLEEEESKPVDNTVISTKTEEPTSQPSGETIPSVISKEDADFSEEVEAITSLNKDSPYLDEKDISESMSKLLALREHLLQKEELLAKSSSELETKLCELKNEVHVKRIMYEHLQQQLESTKKELKDTFDEYKTFEEERKKMLMEKRQEIGDIRNKIENIGSSIRKQVNKLDMKQMRG